MINQRHGSQATKQAVRILHSDCLFLYLLNADNYCLVNDQPTKVE